MITENDIEEYKKAMFNWIVNNTEKSYEEVMIKFQEDKERIDSLFKPYPETIVSEDPVKWAELLALSFGFLNYEDIYLVEDAVVCSCDKSWDSMVEAESEGYIEGLDELGIVIASACNYCKQG